MMLDTQACQRWHGSSMTKTSFVAESKRSIQVEAYMILDLGDFCGFLWANVHLRCILKVDFKVMPCLIVVLHGMAIRGGVRVPGADA